MARTAVEQARHTEESQGQIRALAFRFKVFKTFKVVPSSLGRERGKANMDATIWKKVVTFSYEVEFESI